MRRGPSTHDFTLLLRAWGKGDRQTFDCLAQGYMAHARPNHTQQATALAHEVYLRLIDPRRAISDV